MYFLFSGEGPTDLGQCQLLNQILQNRSIDINRITMPSFAEFRNRLEEVI